MRGDRWYHWAIVIAMLIVALMVTFYNTAQ